MEFWEYLLLFLCVVVSGGLGFLFQKNFDTFLKVTLSFSGAYILGITFLHLVPEVYQDVHNHNLGYYVLAGFLIQLLLEQLSKGIEHGHIHAAHEVRLSFVVSVMLGLCLHAFIEGMPLETYQELGGHHHHHSHDQNHLLYGIMFHKIPAAFALSILLLASGFKRATVVLCLVIFASMSPLGSLLAKYLNGVGLLNSEINNAIMAIVIGSFLHISTTILFETEDKHHRISFKKFLAIIIGLSISLLTL